MCPFIHMEIHIQRYIFCNIQYYSHPNHCICSLFTSGYLKTPGLRSESLCARKCFDLNWKEAIFIIVLYNLEVTNLTLICSGRWQVEVNWCCKTIVTAPLSLFIVVNILSLRKILFWFKTIFWAKNNI